MTDDLPHPLRSDALDNRQRVLAAARGLFAAEGVTVPMREIARHAGVGPATLYRRFPTKQALIAAAFAEEVRMCHAIVDEGLAEPDPWRGFRLVIEKICVLHARNRGFTEAFASAFPGAREFTSARERALAAVAELAERAKRAGHLRPDFVLDDLVLVLMANRGIRATTAAGQVAASRRFAALVLQALQAAPHHAPLPPAARLAPGAPGEPAGRGAVTGDARPRPWPSPRH
ncbi:TetR/AcrR family transcriptional regulator [Goodfellowiella coeruleoviolacea]|uniref:Transcriptional regulator, TetR family n=1 Tax=Goodfellowiella coeruleoviolacea TaxID=334858 RepID=A0AAE3KEI1_9PSEU|nr:TetR/AcrR family transcriptional regulator [Goodfellowiella coeruleoviolacea]MCP2163927.1 transcriptional regulator, TetR family [Goodfellowiella coeruleoviolacea]